MDLEKYQKNTFNPDQFDSDFGEFTKEVSGIVDVTAPDGASKREQMTAFLSDETSNPKCIYPKLHAITDGQIANHRDSAEHLLDQVSLLTEPYRGVYEAFIRQNLVQADLIMAMKLYNEAATADKKSSAREEFMKLNVELYGEPDK